MIKRFTNMNFKTAATAALLLASSTCFGATSYAVNTTQFVHTYGNTAELRLKAVNHLMIKYSQSSDYQKIEAVNVFFNQFTYVSDVKLWGVADYWSTVTEFIGAGAGDCEDYALAKYKTLIKMGVNNNKLRLMYVNSLTYNEAHMVLTYYKSQSSEPLVLDNLKDRVLPATERPDLQPVYSFNAKYLWLVQAKHSQRVGNSSRLSMWNKFTHRSTMRKPLLNMYV